MTTLQTVELGVLGPLQVRQYGLPVSIPGAKPRAILTMLGLHGGSVVSADTLVELLWGDDPPRTAAKALQTHISSLRRTLGDGFVLTQGTGWTLSTTEIDATRYKVAARLGRDAVAAGDTSQAVASFDEALTLWRGTPELPDGQRGVSEKTRWIEGHAALVEDRADALLATGRAAEIIGDLEAAIADAPLRERRWGQLILALYRAGRQGEALGAYQRVRSILADQLGVDPGPDLRRLEAAIVTQDIALEMPVSQQLQSVTRAVTFLLTDIEGSTAAWEADADAMAVALARHDEIVEQVVTSRGGRLIKTRGEGDATFSVFDRPSAAAAGAIELQEAIFHEPWALAEPMRIRVALHTGEVELRDGDYFGRAVNRAARLRSLAAGGQILCSGATAELVIDTLPDDVVLADLGMRQLKNLPRPEHVFELRLENADDFRAPATEVPIERPALPAVLAGPGPFVGRGPELERLLSAWQTTLDGGIGAVLIAGEPGVGKTRLAGEWSRHAYEQGAVVLYGRCDEDLGAPYQPFAEALRSLVPCLGSKRLRGLRGVEALLPLVPGLADALPDLAAPTRADPDTERYALFDAVVAVLGVASTNAPVVLILDDLHWAAKPTLLLLRHLLRFGEHTRVQIVGTYRSTDLDRSHPLAAMLADLHRDGSATRLQLSGLDEVDVSAFVAEAGYDDEELGRALASVTGGNPFFLIEALRHVDESGGRWDSSTLPQGVREAVSRRLSRLPAETNKALAAAAVVGSRFSLELVERVVGDDLIDAFDEACKAGIVIEEPGGRYRFNHALVRQSLLAELASVRRMRLHQSIAATLETEPGADELLADLAHHYFECAWAGNAAKAVDYCRRAADQAMARLAYEGAADLYDRALHALEELDEELPDRDDQQAELLVARCEALLAAGDVASAAGAVSQLQAATRDSPRLAAWGTCFDGQLSMLTDPERLDEIESALAAAAEKLAELDDAAGEAKAHTVRAGCVARLGRIADAETALDHALTAARRAREHRRVNAVLANAPLAALWGPNPVPRAGGRCLDVVRLLRITTGSPVVEATSTRCQAVLDALRGRAAAGRSLLDSARRTLTELGMRHALLEVDQFAGILELVADDPAAAEPHLRRAYNGFRRMGLDADTAETAALLARACLTHDRDAEADELCTESERLAGHALKASIAWRTVRAQLLARNGAHDEARRVAEEAVAVAERTDLLVDHGDACLGLATVLGIAGDSAGARAAANKAVGLYELKGAAALAEKARTVLSGRDLARAPTTPEAPSVETDNACVQAGTRLIDAVNREAWDDVEQLLAPDVSVESRRKIVGFPRIDIPSSRWPQDIRRFLETGLVRYRHEAVAVRGQRLALTRLQVGTADASPGAPEDEFLQLYGINEEGRVDLQVWFDVEDIDAAIAELDAAHARLEGPQLRPPLENAASRADARFNTLFAERRFDEIGALFIDDLRVEDRRRGLHRVGTDRATELAEVRAIADLGTRTMTSDVIAIRGERLALVRTRYSGRDDRPDAFHTVVLRIAEIGADERIVAYVAFDLDDMDAAFAELDARYLAGEAAPYRDTWPVIAEAYASIRRHELPPTMSDCVGIDHRRAAPFAPGDMVAWIRTGSELGQVFGPHMEVVHRLTNRGGVITYAAQAKSPDGFDAEWREISMSIVDGDMITRCELFDEADIDAALAKFDELSRPAHQLENAASRVYERVWTYFAAHDWVAVAENLADDMSNEDRRRVANAGIRHGRDELISDMRTSVDLGLSNATFSVTATRGNRLVLTRAYYSTEAYQLDGLDIIEIDADDRVAAVVSFDPDDIDAAFEELDARYLAGEAASHAQTWSAIARARAALVRHELPRTTPDWVNVDHRRGIAFAPGDMTAYFRAVWDTGQDFSTYIEAVHRLNDVGAVFTQVARGTMHEGFYAEWRIVEFMTAEGDLISRAEFFDDTDIDAAIARFDELTLLAPRLENAASRVADRLLALFGAHDWDVMAEMIRGDFAIDDRRRTVNGGVRHGRDAEIEDLRAAADVGFTHMTSTVIATRGARLILTLLGVSGHDPNAMSGDALQVIEIDSEERIAAVVVFDLDDKDGAVEELDARYLAGEAAPYRDTWPVIADAYASVRRGELPPMTPDCVYIDHRHTAVAIASGDLIPYLRATWELDQELRPYVEVVHRLTNLGAVISYASYGTSREGFDAEWREISVSMVDGDMINRAEIFDEADLDAALARFDDLSRPTPRLENAASRAYERMWTHFAARNWAAMAETLATDVVDDDRRRVVNAGVRHGRDALILNGRALAEVGLESGTSSVVATRGERLALSRVRLSGRSGETSADILAVVEIDVDNRIVASAAFSIDDIDAAFQELDARYLAGEAADHAHTWSVITQAFAALDRRELPATTRDWVNIDHRRGIAFAAGDAVAYINKWNAGTGSVYVETVHRLSNVGAVVTEVGTGTSPEGFDAEWRLVASLTVEGDLINRGELYDEADMDVALARFDELSRPAQRLSNAASRMYDRFNAYLTARDWDAMAELIADDVCHDDRRRVVSSGIQLGRDSQIANLRAVVDVGVKNLESFVIAIRGERLALTRTRVSGGDQRPEAFGLELLNIVELGANNRISAAVQFDLEDIDAAFEELEARYLAGEAAAHAHTWSLVAGAYASIRRHELAKTTADWVNIDHRRVAAFGPGEEIAYIRAGWELDQAITTYIEQVHRLNDRGALVTHAAHGTSQEGFSAEWRGAQILTVEGEMISRSEIFGEADLDAALTRFDELSRPAAQLENAASRADDRFFAYFAACDWAGIAEILTGDSFLDDRSRVVNVGFWDGRDAVIANLRALAEAAPNIPLVVIATRGDRLALTRMRSPNRDPGHGDFASELLIVVEIDTDDRIAAHVVFDVDNIDAAFGELDARYLASEAAAHAHTWSVIMLALAAANRHELPPMTPDCVTLDHRRGIAFAPGDLVQYIRATWDVAPGSRTYFQAVHRLTDLGAVFIQVVRGTSPQGFDAEWREIVIATVEGDQLNRCELFDEADIDAALSRFDELQPQAPRLENAASRVCERFEAYFAARNWTPMSEMLAEDMCNDDRRRVVGAGILRGRDTDIANMRAIADVGAKTIASTFIATRGERLVLRRVLFSDKDHGPEAFQAELLGVVEIDADERIMARVSFDVDDVDAAFAELDARYLAGEAAAHSHAWSLIARSVDAVNRHELPEFTPDWVNIDHRQAVAFAPGEMGAYIHATLNDAPDVRIYIEAVHRLSSLGVVATQVAHNTSQQGFEAEWRLITISTVEGDLQNRCELFDESDLDAALARFDELSRPAARLENAASRVDDRFEVYFAARDWDAMAELMADAISIDDRRPVVNAGLRLGRDVEIANMRAIADLGTRNATSAVIATRGERLALSRNRFVGRDLRPEAFHSEALCIIEIDDDARIVARVAFDPNELDAAFAELDSRYLAGDAGAHSHAWSVVAQAYASFNRHEQFEADWAFSDRRRGTPFASNIRVASAQAAWNLTPDLHTYVETIHRLSDLHAVVTHSARGTSQEGFDAEWRMIQLLTVEDDRIRSCELFDEEDIDTAIARFDELDQPAPLPENAAARVHARMMDAFNHRDLDSFVAVVTADGRYEDRRKGLRDEGLIKPDFARTLFVEAPPSWQAEVESVATRGARLVLCHVMYRDRSELDRPIAVEALGLTEVTDDELAYYIVIFDPDDIDGAFEELDARYLAGDAAAHAHTWSVIAKGYAALNRRELPATTPDWVNVDHRHGTGFEPGGYFAFVRPAWDVAPDMRRTIEAVHRLNHLGAVFTHTGYGSSREGFDAEWRTSVLVTVDGELINRCELFDQADIDAALARFDELCAPAPQLENAAIRARARGADAYNHRDVEGFLALASGRYEDRRKGLRDEGAADRNFAHAVLSETPTSWRLEIEPVAIRGDRLSLSRETFRDTDEVNQPITVELIVLTDVADAELDSYTVFFDPDDIDAAFAELDTRFLAGEAAAHAHTWSVIATGYAEFNRRQIPPTTPDFVNIDHRRGGSAFAPGEQIAFIRASWEDTPDIRIHIEAVHRLSDLGAVVTQAVHGTSQEGFEAEWREIHVVTLEGELFSGSEMFDEADLDAALARFDELSRPAPQLENDAIRTRARLVDAINRRDLDGFVAMTTADGRYEDRRKGFRDEGPLRNAARALFETLPPTWRLESEPVADRGSHLGLTRETYRDISEADRPITGEGLTLTEVGDDNLVHRTVLFDPEDFNGAIGELTARWIASGEVAHPEVIESVRRYTEAANRHDWDELANIHASTKYVNHRQLASGAETAVDDMPSMRMLASLMPDMWFETAEFLTHSAKGVVINVVVKGTSTENVAVELPWVILYIFDGDRVTHVEVFDIDQRDMALARFDELNRPA